MGVNGFFSFTYGFNSGILSLHICWDGTRMVKCSSTNSALVALPWGSSRWVREIGCWWWDWRSFFNMIQPSFHFYIGIEPMNNGWICWRLNMLNIMFFFFGGGCGRLNMINMSFESVLLMILTSEAKSVASDVEKDVYWFSWPRWARRNSGRPKTWTPVGH